MIVSINEFKYRYFKVSFNFLYFRIYGNSKVFKISNNITLALLAFWYPLVCLLFGWWGGNIIKPFQGIKNTFEAMHINLSGGIDLTEEIYNELFDANTNYIWNNLLIKTRIKIDKHILEIILEIQNDFVLKNMHRII